MPGVVVCKLGGGDFLSLIIGMNHQRVKKTSWKSDQPNRNWLKYSWSLLIMKGRPWVWIHQWGLIGWIPEVSLEYCFVWWQKGSLMMVIRIPYGMEKCEFEKKKQKIFVFSTVFVIFVFGSDWKWYFFCIHLSIFSVDYSFSLSLSLSLFSFFLSLKLTRKRHLICLWVTRYINLMLLPLHNTILYAQHLRNAVITREPSLTK